MTTRKTPKTPTVVPFSRPAAPIHRDEETRPVALSAKGIWKVFGADRDALATINSADLTSEELARRGWIGAVRDASFDIGQGEIFVIMGLSGSGKSTLVRCLTRLIEPSTGRIDIEGEDILAASPQRLMEIRRSRFGMVFQHFALLPNRSVLGNILFPLEVQGLKRDAAEARARELIKMVGLEGRDHYFPRELSGGQQQRVGIARSLATDPPLWFLDEPFSALDPLIRADLQDELLRFQATLAKTVVFITHDLDEAIKIADRIAIMEGGRIVQIATPEVLVTKPATDYVRRFVANVSPAKVIRVRSLVEPKTTATDDVTLDADATIEQVAHLIVDGPAKIAVRHKDGRLLGQIDRLAALHILARKG